ncbi:MAG TPA: hypothetical protein VLN59_06795, partial [Burkholderiales bacterium]|nr:hypothetical protein [Burkholderiales bacterium]
MQRGHLGRVLLAQLIDQLIPFLARVLRQANAESALVFAGIRNGLGAGAEEQIDLLRAVQPR